MTDDRPPVPLDDTLAMARCCAALIADRESRRAYRRAMRQLEAESVGWGRTPAATRMILDVYRRTIREGLGLPIRKGNRP